MPRRKRLVIVAAAAFLLAGAALTLPPAEIDPNAVEVTITVDDLGCAGCNRVVRHAVRSVPGVEEITPGDRHGDIVVRYDPKVAEPGQMLTAIRAAGFHPRIAEAGLTATAPQSEAR